MVPPGWITMVWPVAPHGVFANNSKKKNAKPFDTDFISYLRWLNTLPLGY
jgi:hypothetical protein